MSDDRDDQPGPAPQVQRVGALFSLESKNRFSFRARSKREMGLEYTQVMFCEQETGMRAAEGVGPYKGMRIGKPLRLAALGTSPFRGGKRGAV